MEKMKIPNTLDVSLFGNVEEITNTLSKCRVRIFYKGMNRNRTFISDEFADQLISSLPYTPIKGIFNKEEVDFEGHGEQNSEGKIYGVVMAEPNFSWEDHRDDDGIVRSYACADVLLFTGLYSEAKMILGESQSMEIYKNSLQGEWRISEEDGEPYYHFKKGCLVGLQVLGQEVEPCFEGSAFFNLKKDVAETINYIKKLSVKEENRKMDKLLFRLSDNEKADKIFNLLNPNFNEEGNWTVDSQILDVYDDYCLCMNNEGCFRVKYTRDNDAITLGDKESVRIVDVTETEYNALEAMKAIGSYETIVSDYNSNLEKISELENQIKDFEVANETTIDNSEILQEDINEPVVSPETVDYEKQINDLKAEYETKIAELESEKIRLNSELNNITNEKEQLSEYKLNVEKKEKEEILSKYESFMVESSINSLKENMDKYTVDEFNKEVCFAAVNNSPDIFNKKTDGLVFKGVVENEEKNANSSPLIRLLNQYKNGGMK